MQSLLLASIFGSRVPASLMYEWLYCSINTKIDTDHPIYVLIVDSRAPAGQKKPHISSSIWTFESVCCPLGEQPFRRLPVYYCCCSCVTKKKAACKRPLHLRIYFYVCWNVVYSGRVRVCRDCLVDAAKRFFSLGQCSYMIHNSPLRGSDMGPRCCTLLLA